MCLIVDMFLGPLLMRRRIRSSWNTTSSTRCSRFSMPPVGADGARGKGGIEGKGGEEEAARNGGLAAAFGAGPGHGDGLEAGEARLSGGAAVTVQPGHVMTDPVAAGLNAPAVGVGGLEGSEAALFGRVEKQRDLFGQAALVVLQRQKIIGPAREDGFGDLRLRPHGVDGDERAGQVESFEKQRYSADFI